MQIKNITFTDDVTSLVRNGDYIWISFLSSTNIVRLKKTSAFDLKQNYYSLTVPVDKITRMKIGAGSNIFAIVEDDTYLVSRYSTSNPIGSYTHIAIPVGVNEYPIDLAVGASKAYILTPGAASGENAKLIITTTSAVSQTVDLTTITNARSLTLDDSENIWIVTYDSPAKLVKVYDIGGGNYSYQSWNIEETYT